MTDHKRTAKVKAAAPSATRLCEARVFTTRPTALLVPVVALLEEAPEVVLLC